MCERDRDAYLYTKRKKEVNIQRAIKRERRTERVKYTVKECDKEIKIQSQREK